MSSGKDAERLAISQSALDDLMGDATRFAKSSGHDQDTLDEYLQSVRDTEIRVEKSQALARYPHAPGRREPPESRRHPG